MDVLIAVRNSTQMRLFQGTFLQRRLSNSSKSMTQILLKLAIALVTFEIGVTVTAIYRFTE
jgi:hypothetical protein